MAGLESLGENPGKAIGESAATPVVAENPTILKMPVPRDDHQEQQQQWSTGIWNLEDDACATKGLAGEVTQALGGAQKIVSWIPDIGRLEIDFCF